MARGCMWWRDFTLYGHSTFWDARCFVHCDDRRGHRVRYAAPPPPPSPKIAIMAVPERPLRLVSWNVAGWTSTVLLARELYGGSLTPFLEAFDADVIALQEVKGTRQRLAEEPLIAGACDRPSEPLKGWESFWCHSEDRKSFNGVATFARAGLVTLANARIFEDQELDDEGRCLVTVFREFALFNVYMVNGRGGERREFKNRYASALRAAVHRVRRDFGLPVVLAGDLNMTYRVQDCHWTHCRLDVDACLQYPADGPIWGSLRSVTGDAEATMAADDVRIHALMRLQRYVQANKDRVGSTAGYGAIPPPAASLSHHREESTRQSEPAPSHGDGGQRSLVEGIGEVGQDEESAAEATTTTSAAVTTTLVADHKPPVVWVESLIVGQWHSKYNAPLRALVLIGGQPCHDPADVSFMNALTIHDGMVDSALRAHGRGTELEGRFTVWDQFRNGRYENLGNRIDFILVDAALASRLMVPSADPPSIVGERQAGLSLLRDWTASGSCRDVMAAVTCGGRFVATTFEKNAGLAPLSRAQCDLALQGRWSTAPGPVTSPSSPFCHSFVYTPPQLSDHIACRCSFTPPSASAAAQSLGSVVASSLLPTSTPDLKWTRATQRCKWTPPLRSIRSFFTPSTALPKGSSLPSVDGNGAPRVPSTSSSMLSSPVAAAAVIPDHGGTGVVGGKRPRSRHRDPPPSSDVIIVED